jgi:hypothetical protein
MLPQAERHLTGYLTQVQQLPDSFWESFGHSKPRLLKKVLAA